MFIKENINYVKTSYNDLRDQYMNNIGKKAEENFLFDIDDYGEAKLSAIGKKAIKIDTFKNILEFDHKRALLWMLKYHFMKAPREVDNKFSENVLTKYQRQLREDKELALKNNIDQFLTLNDIEKTSILMDNSSDKTLRALAEIDEHIKDCNSVVKTKILECCLNDRSFIQKAKYYRVAFNFTKKIWDASDVKSLASNAVVKNKNDDLHFYNILLSYGQKEIFDDYDIKTINKNKQLKYILDKCGYKFERMTGGTFTSLASRSYIVDQKIKEYYGFIE